MLLSLLLSIAAFAAYIIPVICRYGVPTSVSESFYLLAGRGDSPRKWLFTLAMWATAFTLMPPLLDATEHSSVQFLAFFACAGLCFVGAAPAFKECSTVRKVHIGGALISACCSQLLIILGTSCWWITVLCFAIGGYLAIRQRPQATFYLELSCFVSMFAVTMILTLS